MDRDNKRQKVIVDYIDLTNSSSEESDSTSEESDIIPISVLLGCDGVGSGTGGRNINNSVYECKRVIAAEVVRLPRDYPALGTRWILRNDKSIFDKLPAVLAKYICSFLYRGDGYNVNKGGIRGLKWDLNSRFPNGNLYRRWECYSCIDVDKISLHQKQTLHYCMVHCFGCDTNYKNKRASDCVNFLCGRCCPGCVRHPK
jgi:hypothetical protein